MNEVQIQRTPELIGSEIRSLTTQAKNITLWFGIEIGRRLCEAKEMMGHGEWLPYLKEQTEFSQSTASRFMTLFKEYGSAQSSLFGAESNYPTLNNLSISNALRLLALPAEEREEFAEVNDVEHMSSRELGKLIKEKQEAEARATAAENALQQADEGAALAKAELEEQIELERQRADDAKKNADELNRKLKEASDEAVKLAAEVRDLKNRPIEVAVQVDEKAVEKAKEETAAEYSEKLAEAEQKLAAAEDKVAKLKEKAKKAEEKAADKVEQAEKLQQKAELELERMQKRLQLSDPDTAVFKELYELVQTDFNRLSGCLIKIKNSSPETASKLTVAIKTMLKKMEEDLAS